MNFAALSGLKLQDCAIVYVSTKRIFQTKSKELQNTSNTKHSYSLTTHQVLGNNDPICLSSSFRSLMRRKKSYLTLFHRNRSILMMIKKYI